MKTHNANHNAHKDMIYFSLIRSIDKGGCPICNSIEEFEYGRIWDLLYEHVLDSYIRREIIKGNGLCSYHFKRIVDLVSENPILSGPGAAIIIEDLLNKYIENIEEGIGLDVRCYICKELEKDEELIIYSFVSKLLTTDIFNHYKNNRHSILCYNHFIRVQEYIKPLLKQRMKELQLEKFKELSVEISQYIEKHDYRYTGEISDEEAISWVRAINALRGSGWSSYKYKNCSRHKRSEATFIRNILDTTRKLIKALKGGK